MKRSDMEYKIAKQLMKSFNCDYVLAQGGAILILDLQEKHGMLPPGIKQPNYHPDRQPIYELHEWESEE